MLRQALREDTAFRSRLDHAEELLAGASRHEWIVYAKQPFGGPEQVLSYLAAYTHRIAISERRILNFDGERVRFSYKDYRDGNREKVMDLEADEFLRRYLLHVLPERFVRIRYFGFLANRVRSHSIELARKQLGPVETQTEALTPEQDSTGPKCPSCGIGSMVVIERVAPRDVPVIDSS